MYSRGLGVPRDQKQAAAWYSKAADQGYAVAQYNLGVIYERGQGVRQDYARANMWFNLAASHERKRLLITRRQVVTALSVLTVCCAGPGNPSALPVSTFIHALRHQVVSCSN